HADDRPGVDAGAVLPARAFPGVVTRLSRARYGMEAPHERAGADVVGADVTRGTQGGELLQVRPDDREVAVDRRRRGDLELRLRPAVGHAVAEVDDPALAEVGPQAAGERAARHGPAA